MKTITELEAEIEKIKEAESIKRLEEQKLKNYEKFKNRFSDWVIGKAHADINITNIDYNWQSSYCTIGQAISIHGNMGSSYNPRAQITSCTDTYFHNVWTNKQEKQFQDKLNKLALKEIRKIMNDLHCVLEIMGLQATDYFLGELYPKEKIPEMKEEIWKETIKVLDGYSDKDFKELESLSHGTQILNQYLKEKRPHLIKVNLGA